MASKKELSKAVILEKSKPVINKVLDAGGARLAGGALRVALVVHREEPAQIALVPRRRRVDGEGRRLYVHVRRRQLAALGRVLGGVVLPRGGAARRRLRRPARRSRRGRRRGEQHRVLSLFLSKRKRIGSLPMASRNVPPPSF